MTATLEEDGLSETFAALANSTRRALLQRLAAAGEANVSELAEPFDMSLPAISRHLSVLERAGLIHRGHRAQYRPCVLDAAPIQHASTWLEQYRPLWEARLDRLDDHLTNLRSQEEDHAH